jgi:hypothetical protein
MFLPFFFINKKKILRKKKWYFFQKNMFIEVGKERIELSETDARFSEFFRKLIKNDNALDRIQNQMSPKKFQKFTEFLQSKNLIDFLKNPHNLTNLNNLKDFINEHIATEYPRIQNDFDIIFGPASHKITFVTDSIMKLVLQFLQFPNKSPTMFADLTNSFRSRSVPSIPNWKMYLDFIDQLNQNELNSLALAASTLGIEPLIQLAGYKLASVLNSYTEDEFRKMFKVPVEFKNATLEKLATIDPLLTIESWKLQTQK